MGRGGRRGRAASSYPGGVHVLGEAVAYAEQGGYFATAVAQGEELLHFPGFGRSGRGEDLGGSHGRKSLLALLLSDTNNASTGPTSQVNELVFKLFHELSNC